MNAQEALAGLAAVRTEQDREVDARQDRLACGLGVDHGTARAPGDRPPGRRGREFGLFGELRSNSPFLANSADV